MPHFRFVKRERTICFQFDTHTDICIPFHHFAGLPICLSVCIWVGWLVGRSVCLFVYVFIRFVYILCAILNMTLSLEFT